MSRLIDLISFTDNRGSLTVIEKVLPFKIKRVFYIYNVQGEKRGFHKHIKTVQAAVCVAGSCLIFIKKGLDSEPVGFLLDSPTKCLIIDPEDFHWMQDFTKDAVLLVLASEYYDINDYLHEIGA